MKQWGDSCITQPFLLNTPIGENEGDDEGDVLK